MIDKEPCPDWCTEHDSGVREDLEFDTHGASLWVQRPLLPPVEGDGSPSWWQQLYITAGWIQHDGWDKPLEHGPGMCLQQHSSPPMMIQPDEARQLAAALIAGAEIVEAAQTATCTSCGRSVVPGDIREYGMCGVCQIVANRERRDRLKLV